RRHKTAAPTLPHPVAERNHPYFLRKPLWIFSVNQDRSARQAVQRQHPVRHFIIAADDTGKTASVVPS
ncbi:TPA: hypothetical protein ACKNXM_001825, partial [Neisseria gonorrhoeae]